MVKNKQYNEKEIEIDLYNTYTEKIEMDIIILKCLSRLKQAIKTDIKDEMVEDEDRIGHVEERICMAEDTAM